MTPILRCHAEASATEPSTRCAWRGRADRCDSVAIYPSANKTMFLGDLVTVAGERRRFYCPKCGEPTMKVETPK